MIKDGSSAVPPLLGKNAPLYRLNAAHTFHATGISHGMLRSDLPPFLQAALSADEAASLLQRYKRTPLLLRTKSLFANDLIIILPATEMFVNTPGRVNNALYCFVIRFFVFNRRNPCRIQVLRRLRHLSQIRTPHRLSQTLFHKPGCRHPYQALLF